MVSTRWRDLRKHALGVSVAIALMVGSTMVNVPSAQAATTYINFEGVSCTSAAACTVVGYYARSPIGGHELALAERWDGTSWSVEHPPSPLGAELTSVSCTSPTACTAVGADNNGLLAASWNGSTWVSQPVSMPASAAKAQFVNLVSVSCQSYNNCLALGTYLVAGDQQVGFSERRTPSGWSLLTEPLGSLQAASCPEPDECLTVGSVSIGRAEYRRVAPIADRLSGKTWAKQTVTTPSAPSADLLGLSCPSATMCAVVGSFGTDNAYVEDGSAMAGIWTAGKLDLKAVSSSRSTLLNAVSCAAAASCLAVGQTAAGSLAELWDGSSWRGLPVPTDKPMLAVSCPSATMCMATAVGTVLKWDGTSWSTEKTATP